ncbi:hypothetical protein DL95DRAFT_311499, partial [Leptodontidium sp. 2 PMI_412]
CDGAMPSCTQCCRTGRKCGGYKSTAVFVHYTANSHAPKKLLPLIGAPGVDRAARRIGDNDHPGVPSLQAEPFQISQPIDTTSPNELTSIIVGRFVPKFHEPPFLFDSGTSQVCGAWVEMLPSIVARANSGELITAAVRAFGLTLLDRGPEGKSKNFRGLEAYVATLEKLSSTLQSPENCFRIETAAAVVCLAMVELMLPKSDSNTLAHFGGLGALINMYSPEVFDSGDFHAIFVGCRPVLIFQALTARKSTFLGREEWLRAPFRQHSPSELQMLLGDVAVLSGILEGIDDLQTLAPETALKSAYEFKLTLSEVLVRLSKWEGQFELKKKPGHIVSQRELSDFWFPSLLAANVYIHMWAFQIVCFTELAKLSKLFPHCFCDGRSDLEISEAWEEHNTRLYGLATNICQSMEYLLQDEMLLYGPAAAMWPLATAYTVLIEDVEGNKEQIKLYWDFLSRIRNRGFLSVPVSTADAHSRV